MSSAAIRASCRGGVHGEHSVILTEAPLRPPRFPTSPSSLGYDTVCQHLVCTRVTQSDRMSTRQTLCLLPPPHVWDTNHASCPLPVGLTLVSPTVGLSGIAYAQKRNPESCGHDEEPYARLRGVRHIQTRRCVRMGACGDLYVFRSRC